MANFRAKSFAADRFAAWYERGKATQEQNMVNDQASFRAYFMVRMGQAAVSGNARHVLAPGP